jgi:hypothetical protein
VDEVFQVSSAHMQFGHIPHDRVINRDAIGSIVGSDLAVSAVPQPATQTKPKNKKLSTN